MKKRYRNSKFSDVKKNERWKKYKALFNLTNSNKLKAYFKSKRRREDD